MFSLIIFYSIIIYLSFLFALIRLNVKINDLILIIHVNLLHKILTN